MKRRFLLFMMTALLSVGAGAENLWTSDTEGGTEVNNYGFSIHPTGLTAGDIISFTINTATGEWGNVLTLKTVGVGTDGQWTWDVPGDTDLASFPVSAGTVVSIVVTDAIVTAAEDKGLWITGYRFTVTSIDHEKAAGVNVLNESYAPVYNYKQLNSANLLYAKAGDVLSVTISEVGGNVNWRKLYLHTTAEQPHTADASTILYTYGDGDMKVGTIDITLTADMITNIQNGSFYIGGYEFTLSSIDLYLTSPTVNISSAGYTTFGYPIALDLTDIEAYTAAVSGDKVVLTSVKGKKIPANTGIILEGTSGDAISLPLTTASTDEIGTNDLLVSDGTVTGGNGIYALADKSKGVGFYLVDSSVTIPAGKVYLNTSAGVKEFLGFDFGGETAISAIANGQSSNGQWYNLAGQRVQTPTRGIYIQNGKKVIIK